MWLVEEGLSWIEGIRSLDHVIWLKEPTTSVVDDDEIANGSVSVNRARVHFLKKSVFDGLVHSLEENRASCPSFWFH